MDFRQVLRGGHWPMVMNSRSTVLLLLMGLLVFGTGGVGFSATGEVSVVPAPKEVRWSAAPPLDLGGGVAIVIGDKAGPPERYAAEMLQKHVAKRFKQQWSIVSEAKTPAGKEVLVVLGCRASHGMLDRLCSRNEIELSEKAPGHDGYVIEVVTENARPIVIVGGSNGRGVIYGQDTLFQLITGDGGKPSLVCVSIRDWPSVPWRGRPQTHFMNYFRPGDLDCYMEARVNFIDLRNDTYAFEPGAELDKANISKLIAEARRRGLIVYGTVNCGVSADEYPAALRTFAEFIELGADGLWISFDDKGPGEAPERIVTDVLKLGREHGISGDRIGICPPKGSYQDIDTEFNRKIAGIAGMENALWFWTRWPAGRHLDQARAVGLKSKPAWWHNWPRLYVPHWYIEPPSMAIGWHDPSYELLDGGGNYIDAVMPWGGNTWGPHYIVPVIGWWGWQPDDHDWQATRGRIYGIVFGPGQVETARLFDDRLVQVRSHLRYSTDGSEWQPYCPIRLRNLADRADVLAVVKELRQLLNRLEADAPAETMLEGDQLQTVYLGRMHKELDAIEAGIELPYPEYWWEAHQREVLTAIYDGDDARADELTEAVRDRLLDGIAKVADASDTLRHRDEYVAWWTARAKLASRGWRDLIRQRREAFKERVADYEYHVAVPLEMMARAADPPVDWGSGRWQASNHVLATVLPTEREYAWGNWIGGLYREEGVVAAVFAARRKSQGMIGEYSELEVAIPVSGDRSRLALMLFINHANKDNIGLQETTVRWAGYRFVQLLWNDNRLLWEADVGLPRENGEWFMVDLPTIPADMKELSLRLRVVNRKMSSVNHTIVFVSPIRLIERRG